MKRAWIFIIVVCIAALVSSILYFGISVKPAEPIDLMNFDYAAASREEVPKANVSGVVDGKCVTPNIRLWSEAGGEAVGAKYVIPLKGCPGIPVKVLNAQMYEDEEWYQVITYDQFINGEQDVRMGWTLRKYLIQGPLPELR